MKRIASLLLALALVLCLLPASAFAATEPTAADLKTPPTISNLEIHDDGEGFVWLEVTVQTPANVLNAIDYYENHELGYNQAGYIGGIELQYSIDGGEWQETLVAVAGRYYEDAEEVPRWNGIHETYYLNELHVDSEVRARARYTGADAAGNPRYSDWSNMLTLNEPVDFIASNWAKPELAEADALGLIPDSLKGGDFKDYITRAEFAAVCVKAYEALTDTKASPVSENPFWDTTDVEVLKAYNVGIGAGVGVRADGKKTFAPTQQLDRQTAATMLTRVYKMVALSGWTLETDANYDAQFLAMFTMPATFADDAKISGWARNSVYFMRAKNIIYGMGENEFRPRAVTEAEKAIHFAMATREQAIAFAKRMVVELK